MERNDWQDPLIDELLSSPVGRVLEKALNTIAAVQKNLYALMTGEDRPQLKLLEIATVVQLYLIRAMASGKAPREFGKDDWKDLAGKVSRFAILNDEIPYCEFVFQSYAAYIEASAKLLRRLTGAEDANEILELSETIHSNAERMHSGELSEPDYTEACLWLSLESMMKLLSSLLSSVLAPFVGADTTRLTQAVSQLAFEYGRFVLFAQERDMLKEYLQNQRVLDERLKTKYEVYVAMLHENAERFRHLIDAAFSAEIHESLLRSAALAKAAGVGESELLTTLEDVDDFFLS